jgi:hypothetical protein
MSAACGAGGQNGQPTIAVTVAVSSPTPRNTTPRDPTSAVVAAVQACREKDATALQALIAGAPSVQEIQTMFARGTDVQLLSQSLPEAPEGSVSIDVTLTLTGPEGPEPVQRTWDLVEQTTGGWLFTTLPDCY